MWCSCSSLARLLVIYLTVNMHLCFFIQALAKMRTTTWTRITTQHYFFSP